MRTLRPITCSEGEEFIGSQTRGESGRGAEQSVRATARAAGPGEQVGCACNRGPARGGGENGR